MEGWEPRRLDGEERRPAAACGSRFLQRIPPPFWITTTGGSLRKTSAGDFLRRQAGFYVTAQPLPDAVRGRTVESRYIVAVSTAPEYRHQGMMRALLAESLKELERRGMPFVFLMPAKEAIYRPFGFRYFYEMNTGVLQTAGLSGGKSALLAVPAEEDDLPAAAVFSETILRELSGCYAQRTSITCGCFWRSLKARTESFCSLRGGRAEGSTA